MRMRNKKKAPEDKIKSGMNEENLLFSFTLKMFLSHDNWRLFLVKELNVQKEKIEIFFAKRHTSNLINSLLHICALVGVR